MKTSLITSLPIMLALVGQSAVAFANSVESPAPASEAIAAVGHPGNSIPQSAPVILPVIKQEVNQASPKLQPVEIAQKPGVDSAQIVGTKRLRQIAESIRVERTVSSDPQRLTLIELP